MRRPRSKWLLGLWGVFLVIAPAAGWIAWAQSEYAGLLGCPLNTPRASHPVLVAIALSVGAAAAMAWALWRPHFRMEAVALGSLTGSLAAGAIGLVAMPVLASYQC